MSKRSDGQARGKYTLEFKLEAVRLVKGGQGASVTAKVLGIPSETLDNWVPKVRHLFPRITVWPARPANTFNHLRRFLG